MAEILGIDIGVNPIGFTSGSIGGTITVILGVILILILVGVALYIYFINKAFNIKINDFENIAGQGFQLSYKDRARLIKIGDGGEEILYLKKRKTYRTAYGKKMGKNTYWFAKGQDGYWYNFLLGDLDAKMGILDIEPVDRDMRYMHVAIRKNIAERYNKLSFWDKHGSAVINGFFMLVMVIALWLLIDQIGELVQQATGAVENARQANEPILKALAYADQICSGGSGINQL